MAYPSPAHSSGPAPSLPSQAATSQTAASSASAPLPASARSAAHRPAPAARPYPVLANGDEGDHQREKLQFALAVALTRGDRQRERELRERIDALGGDCEEPGT